MTDETRKFPTLPAFSVRWAPLYLEPIMGSGERVTVAVAVVPDDRQPAVVVPILDEDRARDLFGVWAVEWNAVVDLCVDDLRRHLGTGGGLETWVAPVNGAALGEPKELRAVELTAALRLAVQKSAFLGNPALFVKAGYEMADRMRCRDRY